MKKRVFTLIELMVIIGIIAIFLGFLLFALSLSKAAAKQAHCVGNVKQLALASHLYAVDPSDEMPDSVFVLGIKQWGRFAFGRLFGWECLSMPGQLSSFVSGAC